MSKARALCEQIGKALEQSKGTEGCALPPECSPAEEQRAKGQQRAPAEVSSPADCHPGSVGAAVSPTPEEAARVIRAYATKPWDYTTTGQEDDDVLAALDSLVAALRDARRELDEIKAARSLVIESTLERAERAEAERDKAWDLVELIRAIALTPPEGDPRDVLAAIVRSIDEAPRDYTTTVTTGATLAAGGETP